MAYRFIVRRVGANDRKGAASAMDMRFSALEILDGDILLAGWLFIRL
jgi:hypothetical protein